MDLSSRYLDLFGNPTRFKAHNFPVWGSPPGGLQTGLGAGPAQRKVPGGPYHRAQGRVLPQSPAVWRVERLGARPRCS